MLSALVNRALARLVAVAVAVSAVEANAQGSNFGPISQVFDDVAIGLSTAVMLSGAFTATGSTLSMAKGPSGRGWFAASYVVGTLNLIAAAISVHMGIEARTRWVFDADGKPKLTPDWGALGLATAHGAVFLWNLVVASIGAAQDEAGPSVAPVVLTGRAAGGRRWTGFGVQLSGF